MGEVSLGARVRVAPREELAPLLRRPAGGAAGGRRPEPGQMAAAGRTARVVASRSDGTGDPLFVLDGLPGLWCADWLRPADAGSRTR